MYFVKGGGGGREALAGTAAVMKMVIKQSQE